MKMVFWLGELTDTQVSAIFIWAGIFRISKLMFGKLSIS
jgi:hypothetical protein